MCKANLFLPVRAPGGGLKFYFKLLGFLNTLKDTMQSNYLTITALPLLYTKLALRSRGHCIRTSVFIYLIVI